MKIRKVLMSVSDKSQLIPLAQAFRKAGAEIYASGGTLRELEKAQIQATPAEVLSKSPEAFQGRMKTLSFPIFAGILAKRNDAKDLQEMASLNLSWIDAVVVNFYPFENGVTQNKNVSELTELIDIGGPALVRAAAKNAPHTLVLTDPNQYEEVIAELNQTGEVSDSLAKSCAARAWTRVVEYDQSVSLIFGDTTKLRYGENPHQAGWVRMDELDSPILWNQPLTSSELSYNNILDISQGYYLLRDLHALFPERHICVILKHNNPSGVCVADTQLEALERAWMGDPVSAFGGVVMFSKPLEAQTMEYFHSRFVEAVAAPALQINSPGFSNLLQKRKNLKAVRIEHFKSDSAQMMAVKIPGATLFQTLDSNINEDLNTVTQKTLNASPELIQFGVVVNRTLKSNAISLVAEIKPGTYMLVGAGQGQPNRIDALKLLAVPRALSVLSNLGKKIEDVVLISDAFFPFRDSIDACASAGIKQVVQPGGSIKDADVIQAANENGIAMVFTGKRHFRH